MVDLNKLILERAKEIVIEHSKEQPEGYRVCQNQQIRLDMHDGTWYLELVLQNKRDHSVKHYKWVAL